MFFLRKTCRGAQNIFAGFLCADLCGLCVSVVYDLLRKITTESQRHRGCTEKQSSKRLLRQAVEVRSFDSEAGLALSHVAPDKLKAAQKRGHNSAADSEHQRSREPTFQEQVHR
jgi:hypothetical protein